MNILSVEIDNFLIVDHVSVNLHDRGLVRISGVNKDDATSGSNGAGKSTIIEAVYWGLFGDTLRSLKSVDDVINSNVGGNCAVTVELEDSGITIRVTRYRKHSKYKNNLFLYIDDVDSRGKDNRETQEFIEALIGVDKTTFASSIVFGQGYSKNLRRFSELTDKEQKECLEKILELEVFQDAFSEAKAELRQKAVDLALMEGQVSTEQSLYDGLLEDIAEDLKSSESFGEDVAEKIAAVEENISGVEEELSEVVEELSSIGELDFDDAVLCQENLKLMGVDVIEKKDKLQAKYFEKKTKLVTIKNSISKDISTLRAQKDKLCDPDSEGEDCWYCGGMILEKKILEKSDGFDFEIKDRERSLVKVEEGLAKLERGYAKRKNNLEAEAQAVSELLDDVDAEISELNRLQRSVSALEAKKSTLQYKKETLGKSIKELSGRKNPWDQILLKKQSQLEVLGASVEEGKTAVAAFREDIQYLEFWKKGFSRQGIRSFMLDKVIPFLNEQVNKYLHILTDGGIQVEFNAVKRLASGEFRENFHVAVTNSKAAQTYEGNSGGEKRRIDLAVSLAINDLIAGRSGKRFNILLLDEVFENIDETGTYYVVKVLEELARNRSSVFVITHQDSLADYFHSEICVQRLDGKSQIIQ